MNRDRATRRGVTWIAGLVLLGAMSACAQPAEIESPSPSAEPSTAPLPSVTVTADIEDPDELIWFGEAPDAARDPAEAEIILSIDDLDVEPADLDPAMMLPPVGTEEGSGHGTALDPDGGLGEWVPSTPICEMFPLAEWKTWTRDAAAYTFALAQGEECGYFTSTDLQRMILRFESDSLARADETGTAEKTELSIAPIPAFWQLGHPVPYGGTFVATIEGMTVSAAVFSRDPAQAASDWRDFAEKVVNQAWGSTF